VIINNKYHVLLKNGLLTVYKLPCRLFCFVGDKVSRRCGFDFGDPPTEYNIIIARLKHARSLLGVVILYYSLFRPIYVLLNYFRVRTHYYIILSVRTKYIPKKLLKLQNRDISEFNKAFRPTTTQNKKTTKT